MDEGAKCEGFTLFPAWGLLPGWKAEGQTEFESEDIARRKAIKALLEQSEGVRNLPQCPNVEVHVRACVPRGTDLCQAHATWSADYFKGADVPRGFPSQADDATCPDDIWRVEIHCIESRNDPKGSWHGFDGYYVSLLIDMKTGAIWDARGERS